MKKLVLNIDYSSVQYPNSDYYLRLYSGDETVKEILLPAFKKDGEKAGELIDICEPKITVEIEVEGKEKLMLSLNGLSISEEENYNYNIIINVLVNLVASILAFNIREKKTYESDFISTLYSGTNYYKIVSDEEVAVYDITIIDSNKATRPMAFLKWASTKPVNTMEVVYPNFNFKKDFIIYLLVLPLGSMSPLLIAWMCYLLFFDSGPSQRGGVFILLFLTSAIIYPIRNIWTSSREYIKLKNADWDLGIFADEVTEEKRTTKVDTNHPFVVKFLLFIMCMMSLIEVGAVLFLNLSWKWEFIAIVVVILGANIYVNHITIRKPKKLLTILAHMSSVMWLVYVGLKWILEII